MSKLRKMAYYFLAQLIRLSFGEVLVIIRVCKMLKLGVKVSCVFTVCYCESSLCFHKLLETKLAS